MVLAASASTSRAWAKAGVPAKRSGLLVSQAASRSMTSRSPGGKHR